MASRGYPESSSSGDVITGIDDAEALDGVHVIHAGTALRDGSLVTAGGRVLAVIGTGGVGRRGPRRGVRRRRPDLLRRRPAPDRHRRGPIEVLRCRQHRDRPRGVGRARSGWSSPRLVVADDDVLATVQHDGTPLTFPEHPGGPHPWSHQTHWQGTTVLKLRRPDEWYSVWKFFDAGGAFQGWYVNFERPYVRRAGRDRHRRPRAGPRDPPRRPPGVEGRRGAGRPAARGQVLARRPASRCSPRRPSSPTCWTGTTAGGRRGTTGRRIGRRQNRDWTACPGAWQGLQPRQHRFPRSTGESAPGGRCATMSRDRPQRARHPLRQR